MRRHLTRRCYFCSGRQLRTHKPGCRIERRRREVCRHDRSGPEFRGRALAAWSEERGIRLKFIQPGKPVQRETVLVVVS